MQISPILRLMRLNQPIGIWLLLWPCWWALALASHELPLALFLLFGVGAALMRSAGCIINDMADREFDARVERTRQRPLASGEVTMPRAFLLLSMLLTLSSLIAVSLGKAAMLWAALSLPLMVIYPFMKRVTWWPQLFLGLTFNWGALMGWVAVRGAVEWPAALLYLGGIFWTLGYDTIYAHQDKVDDAVIGVKSTALKLGNDRRVIGLFYLPAVVFWVLAGWAAGSGMLFFAFLALAVLQLGWQVCTVDFANPASCRRIFSSNRWLGLLVFAGCALAHL